MYHKYMTKNRKTKKQQRGLSSNMVLLLFVKGGVTAVRRAWEDKRISRAVLLRLKAHLREKGGSSSLLEFITEMTKPAHRPRPEIGKEVAYKATLRGRGQPVLRVPLYHVGKVKKGDVFGTTFLPNEQIKIRRLPR